MGRSHRVSLPDEADRYSVAMLSRLVRSIPGLTRWFVLGIVFQLRQKRWHNLTRQVA